MGRLRWLGRMLAWPALMLRPLSLLFFRNRKQTKQTEKPKEMASQIAALPYLFTAVLIFGGQGLAATLGALELVFPDLPSPIPFQVGRAVHLNFSVYWPLLGSMGLGYYWFVQEAKTELHSRLLAWIGYGAFILSFLGIASVLMFGYTAGREYLEALAPLKLGIILSLILLVYNLLRTYLKSGEQRHQVTLIGMLLGAVFVLAQYLPNLFSYLHPSLDDLVRFWVVHMTEEMSLELLDISAFTALLLVFVPRQRSRLQAILFFNIVLTMIGGIFATGHHYYWIGNSKEWLWIGGIFSFVQVLGILFLVHIAYQGIKHLSWRTLSAGNKLVLALAGASVLYHVLGAGLLGMIMSIPQWNRYSHGTFITSAHAHLALFGAVGMLVLTGATYVLTRHTELTKSETIRGFLGFSLLNAGLLLMATMLLIAGLLQTYLWRITGLAFMDTQMLIRPYLIIRAAGGALFALGDVLFVSALVPAAWRRLGWRIFLAH